ncbi:Hsp33 family molecular chaperone HslO [Alteromonas oceanisediminis]|uniref:Hsp33 family molecular chaperone HslO n=1 Tax=Alteromonas oceanisediminis TaxID=2836180 RepID=UPI001BDA5CB5|nr:Hsp33 family molecular chaperone HslO [Alteromonas oceanisediminis]MBT0587849.1 Hsp33 family molecular chaperone HslO [Alteromonas oceanisediminis]
MTDQLQRYLFADHHVRGELVQLDDSFTQILATQDYPQPVQRLLGEMLAAATLLTATLKFKGEVSLQIQSEGAIKYAVVDATHDQKVRGVARYDDSLTDDTQHDAIPFSDLFIKGVMAITITPAKGERYQGLVGLTESTLAACLEDYFTQSEQLATRVQLLTSTEDATKRAGGLLLQILPESSAASDATQNHAFNDLAILTDTMTADELFSLDAKTLLHRLYHEYDVTLYAPHDVVFSCSCSKERSAQALQNIDKQELLDIVAEEGCISMDCQYCHAQYQFDAMDIEAIHAGFSQSVSQQDGDLTQ